MLQSGGFRRGALLEDSDLTLSFYRAGYRVRFVPEAVSYYQVPETFEGYYRQHTRWARGFNDVARDHIAGLIGDRKLPLLLRLELCLFAAGYLDRLAFMGAAAITGVSFISNNVFLFPLWILCIALLTPLAQIIALFVEQRLPRRMWIRLPVLPFFFLLDIMAAVRAAADSLLQRERVWIKTVRGKSGMAQS